MSDGFLRRYLAAFDQIEGWFSPDAALMFMAYAELTTANGVSGSVLEIGVHHGLSAIALSAIRGPEAEFVAVDLFDRLQAQNLSHSGSGSRDLFERNMRTFFGDTGFVRVIAADSGTLTADQVGQSFAFCHVDGGHTSDETYHDLALCTRVLAPGGLLALDDYFNPSFPGVCEGAIRFWLANQTALMPIATGFNKVLFQKLPAAFDLNHAFDRLFPFVNHKTTTFWNTRVHAFTTFAAFIDVEASTPRHLTASEAFCVAAELTPGTSDITARHADGAIRIPVQVVNRSSIPFDEGAMGAPFGLSYHLISGDGRDLRFDNRRNYFKPPLAPGATRIVDLVVELPDRRGRYEVEVDIVWEGITWLKQRGLDTPRIALNVV